MKNKNVRFFCSALAFLVLLTLILIPLSRLLARKSLALPWNTTTKISGFYNEEQDQFEVMFFGSSHAYAAFSPLELWEETGVKSYVFATQQQPLWATYTYIKEALKTQSPALVVVECRMAFGDKEYYMEGNDKGVTFSYMDDIPLSWNKVQLAWHSAPDLEGKTSALFNFMMYHGRWKELHLPALPGPGPLQGLCDASPEGGAPAPPGRGGGDRPNPSAGEEPVLAGGDRKAV